VAPRPQNPFTWCSHDHQCHAHHHNEFRFNTPELLAVGRCHAPPQLPGLGGAVEIASGYSNSTAESSTCANTLIPYNVGTQCTRSASGMARQDGPRRFDHDQGNHLSSSRNYQRNYDYHMRTDNGAGINDQIIYQVAATNINFTNSQWIPTSVPTTYQSNYRNLYSEVLGLVSQPQVAYTRSGNSLTLNPVGQPAFDQSIIPFYNVYFSDTWHMKPTFTMTYSLGWALELPPYEINGKQPSW